MPTADDLRRVLNRIDGRNYKDYKDIAGYYTMDGFELAIDHVQSDPFANPSKIRVRVPQRVAQLPAALFANPTRRIALQDFLTRAVYRALRDAPSRHSGSGKSGLLAIDVGGQEVLERTAIVVTESMVEARLHIGLPAAGRSVLGRQAEAMLCRDLAHVVERGLRWANLSQRACTHFVECVENQEHIREQLAERGLVAFVADGAILPRASGATDQPLEGENVVPFTSPESLRVSVTLLNALPDTEQREISGMGLPNGVTLIIGGGFHGKSTLLQALERGVYPHVPGDGREYVVTNPDAVKIRAEDGRRVERVDISPFINNLPFGRSTTAFSTDNASGSTSQAANIVEAVEIGASTLLLDEDTSATNFMVRDARMQQLVPAQYEPITPFLDRVRELHSQRGVSTVLVMGGSGDYLDVADTVIMLRDYQPYDVTNKAHTLAQRLPTERQVETPAPLGAIRERVPQAISFDASRGKREVKIDAKAVDRLVFGEQMIDLRGVEQLLDFSQTRAIGNAIYLAAQRCMDNEATLREVVACLEDIFDHEGLDVLDPYHKLGHHPGNFARPRRHEVAAAINRLRSVQMRYEK